MSGVRKCNSYDCKHMPKTGTGCTTDIDIVDGVCINYSEGQFTDPKIKSMKRSRGSLTCFDKKVLK